MAHQHQVLCPCSTQLIALGHGGPVPPRVGDVLKELWVVFKSIRHGSNLLREYLGSWSALHLQFVDPDSLPLGSLESSQWVALGLAADKVEVVACAWRLQWAGKHLLISNECQGDEGIY
eukprot:3907674-Lingulodinium_polyedra.AAC.1